MTTITSTDSKPVDLEGVLPYDHSSSAMSDYNISDSLLHLISSQPIADEKVEATVHPKANLDMLTGAHRGPAVPLSILKENPRVCVTCGVDFKSRTLLHAHLMRHRHILGTLEQFTRLPKYECRSCEGGINCSSMLKHKCFSKQQQDIKGRIKVLDRDGSPLICILCRGRLFPSRVHLIIHIIVAHSMHRDPYRCVFCQAEFHSENLLMQEVHAFDCHAPELFMITRKACFKMIRNLQGVVVDAANPFTCFYDANKLEGTDLRTIFRPKVKKVQMDVEEGSVDEEQSNPLIPKRRVCTDTFFTLDEYITHLCCVHGAVAPECFEDNEKDPVEYVRRAKAQTNRVPGPTVRELLESQAAGHHAPKKGTEDEFSPPGATSVDRRNQLPGQKKRPERSGPILRPRHWPAKSTYGTLTGLSQKPTEMCRICLEYFSDEKGLKQHIVLYHAAESRKRLKHLAEKEKLSGVLDIELLCTECYIMFPDTLALQVHMMVSHASKDWRHCGLCGYEFYSDGGGTPSHLKLVTFNSDQTRSQVQANPLFSDGVSQTNSWPLPAELMWRIIITHETRHRERLYQPRPVPYLPLVLIDQLLKGKAIQAVMAANWLARKAQEEIEGIHSNDEQLTNVPDLITTEEAFADGPNNKIKQIGVDEVMVEEATSSLITVLQNEEDQEDENGQSRRIRAGSLRLSTHGASAATTRLPIHLVRKFNELGELNAARQVELDFAENL